MSPKSRAAKGKEAVKGGATAKARVKVADAVSLVSRAEVRDLNGAYTGFSFRLPKAGERAHDFREDEVCFYLRHLRDGMWLPLQSCFVDFFKFFGLVPAQLSPNAVVYLQGLKTMLSAHLEWNMENLMSFVRVSSNDPGIYHLKPANGNTFGITGTPDSVHGWKERFVFVKSELRWGFPTVPKITSGPVRRSWPAVTDQVSNLYTRLKCQYLCLDLGKNELIPYEESPHLSKKRLAEEEDAVQTPPPKRRCKSTTGKKPAGPLVEAVISHSKPKPIPEESSEGEDSEHTASSEDEEGTESDSGEGNGSGRAEGDGDREVVEEVSSGAVEATEADRDNVGVGGTGAGGDDKDDGGDGREVDHGDVLGGGDGEEGEDEEEEDSPPSEGRNADGGGGPSTSRCWV